MNQVEIKIKAASDEEAVVLGEVLANLLNKWGFEARLSKELIDTELAAKDRQDALMSLKQGTRILLSKQVEEGLTLLSLTPADLLAIGADDLIPHLDDVAKVFIKVLLGEETYRKKLEEVIAVCREIQASVTTEKEKE